MNYYSLISINKHDKRCIAKLNSIIRFIGSIMIPFVYILTFWNVKKRKYEEDTIISLTSFGKRLSTVWITIESLLRQKNIYCQIHFYISENEKNIKIPFINHMKKNGVVVHYVEDLKSYKKFYFAAKEYGNKNIITVDDDIIYPNYLISSLIKALNEQACVCCFRCHEITKKNGVINSYKDWNEVNIGNTRGMNLLPTGVGGIIYPKGYFSEELLNKELFMKMMPTTDDIWIRFWGIAKGIEVYKVSQDYKNWIAIRFTQKNRLGIVNNGDSLNDLAINSITSYIGFDEQL